MPDNKLLKNLIDQALDKFYALDGVLLKNDLRGTERSCVFRIGIYLQDIMNDIPELAEYSLDCEYNKSGRSPKRLHDKLIRSDMILHKRSSDADIIDPQSNLLAIEFKGYWSRRSKDIEKLQKLTDSDYGYCYQLGAAIKLTPEREKVKITYLTHGKIISD